MAKQKVASQISLVGGETLLGRELQEVFERRQGEVTVKSYAASGEGNFGEQEGEAVYVEPLTPGSIKSDSAILFAGAAVGAEKTYELVKEAGGKPPIIDCTGLLENRPEARITSPTLEDLKLPQGWLFVISHPAATGIAMALVRLSRYRRLRGAVINIFEPASERGKTGITELHQQTTNLLAFKTLPKDVFDAQLSFNLLPQYGEDAPAQLSAVEQRIERELATLLSRQPNRAAIPMPSLRLSQAPVFHGYSLSLWVEFESDINAEELGEALATAQIEVRSSDQEPPSNVGVATQSGLTAGDIRVDRNNPRAAWIWIVMDNLRMTADAASDILRILGTEQ